MSSRCSSIVSNREECEQSSDSSEDCNIIENNSQIIENSSINLRFPIYVESMTGTIFKLDVFPSDSIRQIKEQLENTEGIPVCQQHLIWSYKELNNEMTIEETSISFGSRLRLVVDLITGPISKTPININLNDINQSLDDEESIESKPLTILLFQNGDQIKVISITSNNNNNNNINVCENDFSNNFDSDNDLIKTVTIEKSKSREEEDSQLRNKIDEIQNQLKSLELRRKQNNLYVKQFNFCSEESINSKKLPNLDKNSINYISKEVKSNAKSSLHLPPISIESKQLNENESTRLEKQYKFIKQILTSIDTKSFSHKTSHSLTSNKISSAKGEYVNRLDPIDNKNINLIRHSRPLTAPVFNAIGADNHINLCNNNFSKFKPGYKRNILSRQQNSAKTNRLMSGRRLPPIVNNNSNKKVNKIRCSFCRIKLGIVCRYKCSCV